MDLKETIKGLRQEIEFEKNNNPNDLNEIGWGMQKGILISVNDLEKILDLCEGKVSDENGTLPIPDVSNNEALESSEGVVVCDVCNDYKVVNKTFPFNPEPCPKCANEQTAC